MKYDDGWKRQRNAMLTSMDMEAARKSCPESAMDGATLLVAMHKARVICVEMDPVLRKQSLAWLRERGYNLSP